MFKKFFNYYKPYKKLFTWDIICAITVSAIDLAFPQFLRYITGDLLSSGTATLMRTIFIIALVLLVMYVIRYFCQYYITSWGHIMGAKMERDMRQELFYHYQKLSFSYYDKNNTGEMISRLVTDLFDISELAHHGPENLILSTLKLAGSFILLMTINVQITLLLLAITVFMVVFSIIKNREMRAIFTDNRKKIASVNAKVQDSLLGIRVIKSFSNEELEHKKFDNANREFFDTKASSYKAMGSYHSVNSFLEGLLYITAIISGGYFFINGRISPMEFAMYFLYIGIFISPIDALINFTELFQRGYSGFKRFVEVIETTPEIQDKKDARAIKITKGNISYNNVSFSYEQDISVINNINLDIAAGETIALVGPSGGGKTTICSLLPRFYDITNGEILIDGINIKDFKLQSLRENIGIVQQDVYIFSGSLYENIAYGKKNATEEEIVQAAKRANIHDFISSLPHGYNTYVGERGAKLSGGQKQRISIARVFLKNPSILILDEATSALDNESEKHIQEALDALSENRTTIIIAHRLSTIRNAKRIYVIADGNIKEIGTHKELMDKKALYAKYYNMQFTDIDDLD